ncbi:TIGR04211 family SH3 domain-containing protein [Thiocystis violascens]|uniref:SH3 domain protein n=1 Tax=Thiocystis violascens (strain ATCC 17096 / DSM 198 / 6111) TaxID=765911 RepID=I3YA22_THIV6|nr:TIGR04211 family SH3 domain-containing protein [Thiocystis violascens]AFL73840.1 SH3 domain protein [Thiocystis violascens DSM 198]
MGRFPLFMLIVVGALSTAPAQAETQYVTDQLQITMRAGESTRYKIIRMLESGTPLDVLSVNQTTEYARVRTEDGKLGYVLISQLQKEPAARAQIANLQTQLAELKQAPDALAAKLSKLQSEHAILIEDAQALKQAKQQLEQELATIRHASANVLEITNERDRLRIQASELTREREELMQEQTEARNQIKQRWFMLGAAVLFGGVLLGLLLPHLKFRRRKSSWGSF